MGHERSNGTKSKKENIDENTTSDALFPFVIVRVQNRKLANATQISQES